MFEWSSSLRSQLRTCSSILQRRLAGLGGAGNGSFARVGFRQNRKTDLLTPSRYWLTEVKLVRKRDVWTAGSALPILRLHRLHAMYLPYSGNLISILQVQIEKEEIYFRWNTLLRAWPTYKRVSSPCPTLVRFVVIQNNLVFSIYMY